MLFVLSRFRRSLATKWPIAWDGSTHPVLLRPIGLHKGENGAKSSRHLHYGMYLGLYPAKIARYSISVITKRNNNSLTLATSVLLEA